MMNGSYKPGGREAVSVALTCVVLVGGVSCQVPEQTRQRPQLRLVVRVQQVQQDGQHPLLLQHDRADHRRPLTHRDTRHSTATNTVLHSLRKDRKLLVFPGLT